MRTVILVIVVVVGLGFGGYLIQQTARTGLHATVQSWDCGLDSCNVMVALSSSRTTKADVGLRITVYSSVPRRGGGRYTFGSRAFVGQLSAGATQNVELAVPIAKPFASALSKGGIKVDADVYNSAISTSNPAFQPTITGG